jgi:hypothetical protein
MPVKPELKIDWATHEAAKYACENWHYSKCMPKSKLVKIGAWENGKFIGVVIFSYGANAKLGSPYSCNMQECVELTRIALTKHKTPVSKILSIALKFLKKQSPGIKLIVSYADADQDHHGGIYQATNWIYEGLFNVGSVGAYLINGEKVHPKSMFDRHGTHAIEQIKKIYPLMQLFYTKGKHKYLMPLDESMRAKIMPLAKPYPKRPKQAEAGPPGQRRCNTDPDAPSSANTNEVQHVEG